MENSGNDRMTEETAKGAPTRKMELDRLARRGLLKAGALSMPLVLTFRSSAAWALSGGCALTAGTKPIPGTFTLDDSTIVIINQSAGDIVTTSTTLTTDQARFLISNGNLSTSCYASITAGTGAFVPAATPTSSSGSTSGGSTSSGSSNASSSSSSSSSSGSSNASSSGKSSSGH